MKTTLKLSFRRPLFALLPLLLGMTSASLSAAPRAGVAVGYTRLAIPAVGAVPATTAKDFFQICTNDNGECAFIALGDNGKNYLMSNGVKGRTAAPVVIMQADSTLICLQNNGAVASVSNGGLFYGASSRLDRFAGRLGAVSLAENTASFLASSFLPGGATNWTGVVYRYSDGSVNPVVDSVLVNSTFTSASSGLGAVFLTGGFTQVYTSNGIAKYQAKVGLLAGVATPALAGTPALNGGAALGNGPFLANVPDYTDPVVTTYKIKMFRANGVEIVSAGGTYAGVTVTAFPQLGAEGNGTPVFLARISGGYQGVIRGGATPAVLLKTGDAAPGISGATVSSIPKFDLDQGGNCVIHAITKLTATGALVEALYRSTRGSAPVLFAQMGDTITVNGQTQTITGFELQSVLNKGVSIGPRVITPNGRVAAYVKFGNDRAAFVFDAQ